MGRGLYSRKLCSDARRVVLGRVQRAVPRRVPGISGAVLRRVLGMPGAVPTRVQELHGGPGMCGAVPRRVPVMSKLRAYI